VYLDAMVEWHALADEPAERFNAMSEQDAEDRIDDRVVEAIASFKRPPGLKQIAEHLAISESQAAEVLTRLRHAGRVQTVAARSGIRYRVKPEQPA
jgi:DNA-binding transcriptional regulator LsrR (DeoR family)